MAGARGPEEEEADDRQQPWKRDLARCENTAWQ